MAKVIGLSTSGQPFDETKGVIEFKKDYQTSVMTPAVKEKLVQLMEDFIKENIKGDFLVGEATPLLLANAVENVWNSLSYCDTITIDYMSGKKIDIGL